MADMARTLSHEGSHAKSWCQANPHTKWLLVEGRGKVLPVPETDALTRAVQEGGFR